MPDAPNKYGLAYRELIDAPDEVIEEIAARSLRASVNGKRGVAMSTTTAIPAPETPRFWRCCILIANVGSRRLECHISTVASRDAIDQAQVTRTEPL